MKRKSVEPKFSMCVQPSFIIGTYNEDGSYNFAPITWVSATCEGGDDYMLVISMFGSKKTKLNVIRDGKFSANLVNTSMLPLMDYFGTKHAKDGSKNDREYGVGRGEVLDVPTLDDSPWVYECEVAKSVETGESTTFFCPIRNVQMDENVFCENTFDVDLTKFDPVIYSGKYHSLGNVLGKIGDFKQQVNETTEGREEILAAFHRKRIIMYALMFSGLIVTFMGCAMAMTSWVPLVIGIIVVIVSLFYGLLSEAMFCPFCGQPIGRHGFGEYCVHCGEKIF